MRRVRLTEGDLHRIIKESVNRLLSEMNEGKYINNKQGYFKPIINHFKGEYDNVDVNTGDVDTNIPFSKYAKADQDKKLPDGMAQPTDKMRSKLSQRSYEPNYEYGIDDPQNYFDAAAELHNLRAHRNNIVDYGGKNPNRQGIYHAAKVGIPTNISKKLSSETISNILRDLNY